MAGKKKRGFTDEKGMRWNSASYSLAGIKINKGGVGKTNIVICLANCLASAGKRVLLIDSDSVSGTEIPEASQWRS